VSEKITMLAPIPRASDRTATAVTSGVALRDLTADLRSFIAISIRTIARMPVSSNATLSKVVPLSIVPEHLGRLHT
jgi:hypothetical protein